MPLAASFAKAAFTHFQGGSGKPHSSVTEWIDILTGDTYKEEELDGIPEIVESINLQAEGPAEASRAIRKKLKHGTTHQKYRALVILKALVENGDKKFQTTFSDAQLIDAIRAMAGDPSTDVRVKKKLMSVLASWQRQFKDDKSMKTIANLYTTCKNDNRVDSNVLSGVLLMDAKEIDRQKEAARQKRRDEEEAKRKAKEEAKRKEREARERANRPRRAPFNFEKEKPQIITSIATAAQASNNLINAITLVNTSEHSVEANPRVQECLEALKTSRKAIVRYVQLVENEELIGTLLDTNERIISALQLYDIALQPQTAEAEPAEARSSTPPVESPRGEVNKLQHRQRLEIHRAASSSDVQLDSPEGNYNDLQGLDFGGRAGKLQAPLQPRDRDDDDDEPVRGTLSDYSDYDSDRDHPPRSDTSSQRAGPSSGVRRGSSNRKVPEGDLLGGEEDLYDDEPRRAPVVRANSDPFADPFADNSGRR